MAKLKLRTEIRKEQLIDAALAVLSREGRKGLSVARVAKEVGLVPSAVYRHFKNKDAIILAMIRHVKASLFAYLNEVNQQTDDPVQRLRQLLFFHTKLIAGNRGLARLIFSEAIFSDDAPRREEAYSLIREYLERVENIIRLGQAQKKIRSDIRPQTVAIMFAGLIQPPAVLFHLSDQQFDIQKQARQAWKLFSEMIMA